MNKYIYIALKRLGVIKTPEYDRYMRDNGEYTKRLNYDALRDDSVVFDLGGYKGDWASDIYARYNCLVFVFEPVPQFADFITDRFKHNDKISVYPFGLKDKNESTSFSMSADSSSAFIKRGKDISVEIRDVADFINENQIGFIDLMKINTEGAEYDLLDHLIARKLTKRIGNIQIQFHKLIPDAESRRNRIIKALSKTHRLTYEYKFIWENWELKNNNE